MLYVYSSIASLGGFLFGFDTGVIGGALPYIREDPIFEQYSQASVWVSSVIQGFIVSSTLLGGCIGSLWGGSLSDFYGRYKVLLVVDGLFVAGSLLMSLAGNISVLILGRFVVGIAIGASAAVVPLFIAERVPSEERGSFVSLNIVYVTAGQLIAYVCNGVFAGHWRLMLGISLIPAILQSIGLVLVVESQHRFQGDGGETSMVQMMASPMHMYAIIRHAPTQIRKQLRLGVSLQIMQQIAGINTIMYYTPIILQQAGVQNLEISLQLSTIPAACNMIGSVIGKRTIDFYGRKNVLLSSIVSVTGVLVCLSFDFWLSGMHTPPVDTMYDDFPQACPSHPHTCSECIPACIYCTTSSLRADSSGGSCISRSANVSSSCTASLQADDAIAFEYACPTPMIYSTTIFILICTYLLAFAPGLGTVPWVVGSEIFPAEYRGICMGICSVANWATNVVVSQLFITMVSIFGPHTTFIGIAIAAGSGLYFFRNMPETSGLDFQHIQDLFVESC